jgi:hypothetical protein
MHTLRTAIASKLTLVASLLLVHVVAAQVYKLGDLKTVDGHDYHGVTVTEKSAEGIAVIHDSGVARLRWSEVPAETQRLLGYDATAETAAQQKAAAEAAAAQAKIKEAAARLSPQQLKSLLAKFVVYPSNNKAWQLTFTDPWTVTISFKYTTPAMWYPMGGIALRREDQLRDVLASKFIQNRGGRGFTDEEVQFLDFDTRIGLQRQLGGQHALQLTFPASDASRISQQIARYQFALDQASAEAYDFGSVGTNTFGYNKDKTLRLNDTSIPITDVPALDALVARVPQLQQQIHDALLHQ